MECNETIKAVDQEDMMINIYFQLQKTKTHKLEHCLEM